MQYLSPFALLRLPPPTTSLLAFLAVAFAACGQTTSSHGVGPGTIGQEHNNPDGTSWFVEEHKGGKAPRIYIQNMVWGRLVNVLDSTGKLCHRDYLIGEDIQSDGVSYQLDFNAVTEQTNVTILHAQGSGPYITAFEGLDQNLGAILPKPESGSLPPFSFVPRNATIGIQFSDMLDPASLNLTTIKVFAGVPATVPFEARLLVDPNYGGDFNGQFYPTRVLIDTTVSEVEAGEFPIPLNSVGFPASTTTLQPNVSIHIPTRLDFGAGQFQVLSNLAGNKISSIDNGPVDFTLPTVDVVRAMRSGGDPAVTGDTNNGFLLDLNAPVLVGTQPLLVHAITPDPQGTENDFIASFTYHSLPCARAVSPGDVLRMPGVFAEATAPSGAPVLGKLSDVRIKLIAGHSTDLHAGGGSLISAFDHTSGDTSPCFLTFSPLAESLPSTGLSTDVQVQVRFSEPMDPASLSSFDTFRIQRDSVLIGLNSLVVGDLESTGDLKAFTFLPTLPLAHNSGSSESYFVNLTGGPNGPTDLAGNPLADALEQVMFTLSPDSATVQTSGTVLRFESPNEDLDFASGVSLTEYAGQFVLDPERGVIKARPVERLAAISDPAGAVTSNMKLVTLGVQTPLSPLGSRMMDIYRYFDVGLSLTDPSTYNMDIEGICWAPLGGVVQADSYENFEINLSHSKFLPDEYADASGFPVKKKSGLKIGTFSVNVLEEASTNVHPKELGYIVDPAAVFDGGTGTKLIPYPLNQTVAAADFRYFTWRDTATRLVGGKDSFGVPARIESQVGLIGPADFGKVAGPGNVPTIGLPLLFEMKCYPSDNGVGLNSLDCRIATNSAPLPHMRIFSTGGYNINGSPIIKNPDLEDKPSGGFNSNPAVTTIPIGGATPPMDNVFYLGQLDLVVRVSRTTTRWFDTENIAPTYEVPVIQPKAEQQPQGTEIRLAFRGATFIDAVSDPTKDPLLHAGSLDVYGDEPHAALSPVYGALDAKNPSITFLGESADWLNSASELDGARYTQVRMTMIANAATGLTPEISSFGLAYWLQ